MPGLTAILNSIRQVIAGVTGVGQVYIRRRWLPQDRDFQAAAVTGNRVNFWDIHRASTEEQWPNSFQVQRSHTINVRGFFSSKDASATEETFQDIVERVAARFRLPENRTLNGTVKSLGRGNAAGLQVQSIEYNMIHGVLCHGLQARLTVTEHPTTLLSATAYSGPVIFFANAIGASANIAPSSTSPSFPRRFLIDEAPKTPWRSTGLGVPSVTIDIDLGAATAVRAFGLVNTNFGGGTYRLYHGATSPATNAVTLSQLTPALWVSLFATKTSRYWRLSMQDAGIASGFYQIGELWLGNFVQLSKWHSVNASETLESGVRQHETDGGVRWRLSGFQRESRAYQFDDVTEDGDAAIWERVFRHRGREHPFFYIVNPSAPSSAFFCAMVGPLTKRAAGDDRFTIEVRLDEEL